MASELAVSKSALLERAHGTDFEDTLKAILAKFQDEKVEVAKVLYEAMLTPEYQGIKAIVRDEETYQARNIAFKEPVAVFDAEEAKLWEKEPAKDFLDYVRQMQFPDPIWIEMPEDTNRYITELVNLGKATPWEALDTGENARYGGGEWYLGKDRNYHFNEQGRKGFRFPDAKNMKLLLEQQFPDRDFNARQPSEQSREMAKGVGHKLPPQLNPEVIRQSITQTAVSTPAQEPGPTFSIYQLRRDIDRDLRRDLIWAPLSEVAEQGRRVELQNYEKVYTAPLEKGVTLEDIYDRFNHEKPKDFTGHSLSVSDMVAVNMGGQVAAHYVDSQGFKLLPEIAREIEEAEASPNKEASGAYHQAELFGQPVLFTKEKLSKEDVPVGWFKYELRGEGTSPEKAVTIERGVVQRFAGTILSPDKVDIPEPTGFRRIGNGLKMGDVDSGISIPEFCDAHHLTPPAKTRTPSKKALRSWEAFATPKKRRARKCKKKVW